MPETSTSNPVRPSQHKRRARFLVTEGPHEQYVTNHVTATADSVIREELTDYTAALGHAVATGESPAEFARRHDDRAVWSLEIADDRERFKLLALIRAQANGDAEVLRFDQAGT